MEGLEPSVQAMVDKHQLIPTLADLIPLSTAISAKRIADALDGTALGVDISESLAGVGLAFIQGRNR